MIMVRIAGEYTILSPDWVSYKKVTQNGKFGYINQDKEIVIPIEWDGIYSIIRKTPCHSDHRYTTVDEKDDLFINHIAIARKANKQYLINESGIIHITEQGVPVFEEEGFDDIGSLGDNLIPIKTDNKWGYVDTDGALIIYPEYSYSHVFQDGYCIIGNNGKYGVIDKSNSLIIDVIYDGIEYWGSSAWIVSVHSKMGYISPDRTWNIEPQYDKIIPLNDNLIGVGKIKEPETYHVSHWTPDMVYGIIDKSEKIGSYETSIQPFEDCCTIFVAKHPVTKPNLNIIKQHETNLDGVIEELYKTAIYLRESAENAKADKLLLKDALSDISHRLKTPLTSLSINLENLEGNPDMASENRNRIMRRAKRDVDNISHMVQAILKLSRLEADVVEFDEKDTLLSEIVSEAADNVMALCDLRDIRLSIDEGSDKDACIHADAYWQCEAITNIVKNAVEHAESEVRIGFYRYEMYAEITVQNDGETISDEDKKHIFTRFYSGSGQPADSIGIGLSLAEAIVRHDNGYILVEDCTKDVLNEKNECSGTRFVVRYL